ncbi:MAG: hypothetical protein EA393_01655 [Bacteroidetes bacterium]|nr:MAG: hypothetical protein EA393_01655 [Bacteroidota bacterium]
MKNTGLISFLAFGLFVFQSCQSTITPTVEINAAEKDFKNTPVFMNIEKSQFKSFENLCLYANGDYIAAQAEEISPTHIRLWWIANIPAGEKRTYSIQSQCNNHDEIFSWQSATENSKILLHNGMPLIGYEHPTFDLSERELTYKPFHHVFDPHKSIHITKGPGGLFSHHRGIYFGYNQIRVDGGEPVDIWHNHYGEHSEHVRTIREFTGPVFGGHTVEIEWRDTRAQTFARETRTLKVFHENDQMIIDFHSVLEPVDAAVVELNGDRHHGGVQFRAANEVSENSEETFFTRPPQIQHLSPFSEIEGDEMYDLPWNAMSYILNGEQYNVAYFSHPSNPAGAEMSERRYGRFGEFFPFKITPEQSLEVKYRFIVTKGQAPSVETLQQQYENFAEKLNYEIRN